MPGKRSSPLIFRQLKSGGYVVDGVWRCDTDIKGQRAEVTVALGGRAELMASGLLVVYPGYIWDGASGPVFDRKSNMKAGLAHDALYHMLRAGSLDQKYRAPADKLFKDLVKEEGGFAIVAMLDYIGLRLFGGHAAKRQKEADKDRLKIE